MDGEMTMVYEFAEDFGDVSMGFDLGAALRRNLARTERELKRIKKKIYSERNLQAPVFVNENLVEDLTADFEAPARPQPTDSPDSGIGDEVRYDDFHSCLLSDSEEDDQLSELAEIPVIQYFSPEDRAILDAVNEKLLLKRQR